MSSNLSEQSLPGFLTRPQKSGRIYYYFDNGKKPRKEIPLGPDYDRAIAKYRCLTGVVDGYQIKPRAFYLYRHYDEDGLLLYVGVSLSTLNRLERHREASVWFWNIARVEIQRFSTRQESLDAERTAIQHEHPLFNLRMAHPKMAKGSQKLRATGQKVGALQSDASKMIATNPSQP